MDTMTNTQLKVPVEFLGGPADGIKDEVVLETRPEVFLARITKAGVLLSVHSYEWANQTSLDGKRWIYRWMRSVGERLEEVPSE